jgi:hypothetical protein
MIYGGILINLELHGVRSPPGELLQELVLLLECKVPAVWYTVPGTGAGTGAGTGTRYRMADGHLEVSNLGTLPGTSTTFSLESSASVL